MPDHETVADAVDELLSILKADDRVAFAEVGGIDRKGTEIVVTESGVRSDADRTATGVWCRVFAEGAAAYRFSTDLSTDTLTELANRARMGGERLGQSTPARVDVSSLHRGVHDGWETSPSTTVDLDVKRETVADAVADIATPLDRARVVYEDRRVIATVATTAGSVVRHTIDRASLDATLVPKAADSKVRRHAGSTRGGAFLERVPDVLDTADRDAATLAAATSSDIPTGELTVVLGPQAAAQICHELAGYLAADVKAFGFTPFDRGDRLTDAPLTVDDGVAAGSWAARAYDAECRPTTPIRLVDDGRVESFLHDTHTATEANRVPAGNVVPALGYEQAPRIHHRHLDVAAGDTTREELLAAADVYIRRFTPGHYRDPFERTQRAGAMPPSAPYAHDVAERLEGSADGGTVEFPIAEGFRIEDGAFGGAISGTAVWTPARLETLDALSRERRTLTGVASKHKSRLPYAVTAPAMRLSLPIERSK
ncbi:metallopeptidase TldD-related protein [Halorubrum vacuolatum]|uniref:TldD protein n=1 Tax=Halorubrum vacuolatum TaxID=63740 RepID=A0A238Y0T1_HALVU|nr:metallopeptidase TldD-related protein [Halorubrum vacuolatum]SNR64253.1 TldD protein [Halorubrum vacuolatum]